MPRLKWHPWQNLTHINNVSRAILQNQKPIDQNSKNSRTNYSSIPLACIAYANLFSTLQWTQSDVDRVLCIAKVLMDEHKYSKKKVINTFYIDLIKVTALEHQVQKSGTGFHQLPLLQPIIEEILHKYHGCRIRCGKDQYALWLAAAAAAAPTPDGNEDRIFIFGTSINDKNLQFVCVQKKYAAEILIRITAVPLAGANYTWHIGSVNILECEDLGGCPRSKLNKTATVDRPIARSNYEDLSEGLATTVASSSSDIDRDNIEMAPYLDHHIGHSHFISISAGHSILRGTSFVDLVSSSFIHILLFKVFRKKNALNCSTEF